MTPGLAEKLLLQLEGMQKYNSYQNKIDAITKEVRKINREIEQLTVESKKENRDVERLEKGGLQAFYLKARGKYEETMDREVLEAAVAKLKLDNKQFELEEARKRVQFLRKEQNQYRECEQRYRELYQCKLEELLLDKREEQVAILELQRKISESHHNIKELKEAVHAGKRVLDTLDEIEESLGSAGAWGTWDLLGGGLMSDLMKHSHLDDAKEKLNEVQSLMGSFRMELADVNMNLNIQINTGGFSKFADFFFDGLFSDLNMQNRIHEAEDGVLAAQEDVKDTIKRLKAMIGQENNTIKSYEDQIVNIVNQA